MTNEYVCLGYRLTVPAQKANQRSCLHPHASTAVGTCTEILYASVKFPFLFGTLLLTMFQKKVLQKNILRDHRILGNDLTLKNIDGWVRDSKVNGFSGEQTHSFLT